MEQQNEKLDTLYSLITSLDNVEDCKALFEDMCTRKELIKMAERIFAAKLLMEGNTYIQVMAKAKISSATLSRVSQCVQYGKGYSKLLK
jgi:TrpR-related protein YerC/YecD